MMKKKIPKETNDDNDDDNLIVKEGVVESSKKKIGKKDKKLLKKQRDADLRKRNLGIGIIGKININTTAAAASNKKIIFGDDSDDDDDESVTKDETSSSSNQEEKKDSDDEDSVDDDDDDEVEEVKASDARDEVLEQMAVERETKRVETILTKKSHKKKTKKKKDNDDNEEELGEDFLAELDAQQELDRQKLKQEKKKRKKKKQSNAIATHTTFVSEEDGISSSNGAIDVGNNIQVVVLPNSGKGQDNNNNTMDHNLDSVRHSLYVSSTLGSKPSEAALLFSRERLGHIVQDDDNTNDDADISNNRRKRKADKQFWKRSNKRSYGFDNKRVGKTAFQFKVG